MVDYARAVAVAAPMTAGSTGIPGVASDTSSRAARDVSSRAMPGFWTLHLAGWFVFAVAMVLSRIGVFPIGYMIAAKGSYAMIGAVVAVLLRGAYRHAMRTERSLRSLIVLGVVASYVAALLWTATSNFVTLSFIDPLFRDGQQIPITLRRLINGSLYDAFILLAWSLLYFGIKWQKALVVERERVLRAEAMATEARLAALRYQINPHFLFNALNGVSALVLEQRTQQAAEMLSRLASFLRMTLEGGGAAEVSLDDELLYLRAYLAIEQSRFGERLEVSFDIDPVARRALVPTLLLQPIVENSVRHVLSGNVRGGSIAVDARVDGDMTISIVDQCRDDHGTVAAGTSSLGIGLANTRERLAALYGERASLRFETLPGRGARVVIRLPYRKA